MAIVKFKYIQKQKLMNRIQVEELRSECQRQLKPTTKSPTLKLYTVIEISRRMLQTNNEIAQYFEEIF